MTDTIEAKQLFDTQRLIMLIMLRGGMKKNRFVRGKTRKTPATTYLLLIKEYSMVSQGEGGESEARLFMDSIVAIPTNNQ